MHMEHPQQQHLLMPVKLVESQKAPMNKISVEDVGKLGVKMFQLLMHVGVA